jgi:hypothetical protein
VKRQTENQMTQAAGIGTEQVLHPGCLPVQFQQRLEARPGTTSLPADIFLDREKAIIKRRVGGLPVTIVVPMHGFDGVMVRIVPGNTPGEILASLILKHPDSALSITLVETHSSDELATHWSRWAQVLSLPMLVCDLGGAVKPIEAFQANPAAAPAPRRKLRLLTGRRPRFLNRRQTGSLGKVSSSYAHEREIIARD